MPEVLWWVLAVGLMVAGLLGTVLPLLPGTAFVLGGIVLAAWIDDFSRVGAWALGIVGALAVLSWALEYLAAMLGARRAGASRQAMIGAAIGTVAGLALGIVGVLVLPLVGATLGEYLARRDHQGAARVGLATWVGLIAGLLAKVVLAFMMIGVFLVALWW